MSAKRGVKPVNPKDSIGSDKLPLHLWPKSASAFGCVALANGGLKYGRSNWRATKVRATIYLDQVERHLEDWKAGNDTDPDDGVHNLCGAIAGLAILIDALVTGTLNDDRDHNGVGWRKARGMMEPHIARLRKLHKDRSPKHYTIADNKP